MRIWSIVVAGGAGSRFGGTGGEAAIPKQLLMIAGRRMLDHSVRAMAAVSHGVVVVAPKDWLEDHAIPDIEATVVAGGLTRTLSVRAGLEAALQFDPTHVLIHDAARPAVPPDVCTRVVAALDAGAAAVVPVVPVTDTLRALGGTSVDRSQFVAVQTPQGFEFALICKAHTLQSDASDDASLVDEMGVEVSTVPGDPRNIKVTVAQDLALAEILLS